MDKSGPLLFLHFFEYAQGGRFNYIYGGDINNDGSGTNDLILYQQQHNCKQWF
jgi:hypothetical protein